MRLVCCVVRCCLLHSRCTHTSPGTAAHSGPGRRLSVISCREITMKINKLETAGLHSCVLARVWRHLSLTHPLLGAEEEEGWPTYFIVTHKYQQAFMKTKADSLLLQDHLIWLLLPYTALYIQVAGYSQDMFIPQLWSDQTASLNLFMLKIFRFQIM